MFEKLFYFALNALMFYYLATTLQWYSYKLKRVIFHFSKPLWHVWYFFIPLGALGVISALGAQIYGWIFAAVYAIFLWLWAKRLDKKLIFTARVKRLWAIFFALNAIFVFVSPSFLQIVASMFATILAHYLSGVFESKIIAAGFEKKAKERLLVINPTVIAITASFGKTSIKNFAAHILSKNFRVYATPASVNTKMGVIKDVNENLPSDAQIYIVEAGARAKGDIAEIADLVEPSYAVIGKIGEAHIEYFKSLETIRATKAEILKSKKLKKGFVYENSGQSGKNITVFGFENGVKIKNVRSNLDGLFFSLEIDGEDTEFSAPNLLGSFNAINISAAILVAKELGMSVQSIQNATRSIQSVPHRLQKIIAGQKIIIDDSFNGNIDGIKEGIAICRLHPRQKVVVTCGLVESREELNIELAKLIDESFDVAIITGELNKELFDANLHKCEKLFLTDKNDLEGLLKEKTQPDSIVYFANDAPGYI